MYKSNDFEALLQATGNTDADNLRYLSTSKLPVVIYGASATAKHLAKFLQANGIATDVFTVDCGYAGTDDPENTYEATDIDGRFAAYNLILGIQKPKPFWASQFHHAAKVIVFFAVAPIFPYTPNIDMTYFRANYINFLETYNMLYDDLSRESMIAYLNANITKNADCVVSHVKESQYFQSDIIPRGGVMLDIGAYTGDTLKSFIAYSNGDFKKYIAVEPDTKNFQKLELLVGTLTYSEKIETIQECCSEEPGYLRFNDGQGGSSTISDNDGVTVKAETIDHIASCCGDRITMIKMDIEGSEMRALRGAKHTIASDRPALAICVYHRKSDLITIPQYIKGLAPDYKFYFRLHSPNITEAVLYVAR